jgi:hypothetical protein
MGGAFYEIDALLCRVPETDTVRQRPDRPAPLPARRGGPTIGAPDCPAPGGPQPCPTLARTNVNRSSSPRRRRGSSRAWRFRPADGGAAARAQSAEFLAAGVARRRRPTRRNASQASAAASGGAQTEAGGEDARREAAARADWESFLGKAIGGKLFELVKAQVDATKLTKYAEQGTAALAKEFGKLGDRAFKDDKGQAEALNGFLTALAPELKRLADQWIEGPDGQKILKGVSDWSEEHPRIVTSILGAAIIGAAVAAYLSNMDPPALEKTFKLGRGFTAGGSIDFGPIQKLAIQAASISLGYESEKLTAMVSAKYTQSADGKSTTTIEGQAKGKLGDNTTADGKASVSTTSDGQTTTSLEAGVESQMSKDSKANARGTLTMNPDGSAVPQGRYRSGNDPRRPPGVVRGRPAPDPGRRRADLPGGQRAHQAR